MKITDHKVTIEKIKIKVSQLDNISSVEVHDNSHLHAGHKEAMKNPNKGHFHLIVRFKENRETRIVQHRKIYHALSSIMHNIHALSIEIIK